MVKQITRGKDIARNTYWSAVGMTAATMLAVQPVFADTIWDRFSTILKDVYGQVVAISTIVAVTVAAIALLIRMISRNQRAVEEATSWLKRIVVTWIILNSLGFVVAYLQPLIQGGSYSARRGIGNIQTYQGGDTHTRLDIRGYRQLGGKCRLPAV